MKSVGFITSSATVQHFVRTALPSYMEAREMRHLQTQNPLTDQRERIEGKFQWTTHTKLETCSRTVTSLRSCEQLPLGACVCWEPQPVVHSGWNNCTDHVSSLMELVVGQILVRFFREFLFWDRHFPVFLTIAAHIAVRYNGYHEVLLPRQNMWREHLISSAHIHETSAEEMNMNTSSHRFHDRQL